MKKWYLIGLLVAVNSTFAAQMDNLKALTQKAAAIKKASDGISSLDLSRLDPNIAISRIRGAKELYDFFKHLQSAGHEQGVDDNKQDATGNVTDADRVDPIKDWKKIIRAAGRGDKELVAALTTIMPAYYAQLSNYEYGCNLLEYFDLIGFNYCAVENNNCHILNVAATQSNEQLRARYIAIIFKLTTKLAQQNCSKLEKVIQNAYDNAEQNNSSENLLAIVDVAYSMANQYHVSTSPLDIPTGLSQSSTTSVASPQQSAGGLQSVASHQKPTAYSVLEQLRELEQLRDRGANNNPEPVLQSMGNDKKADKNLSLADISTSDLEWLETQCCERLKQFPFVLPTLSHSQVTPSVPVEEEDVSDVDDSDLVEDIFFYCGAGKDLQALRKLCKKHKTVSCKIEQLGRYNIESRKSIDVMAGESRNTPLFEAIWHCNRDIVNWLLEQNANCGTVNGKNQTPLDVAQGLLEDPKVEDQAALEEIIKLLKRAEERQFGSQGSPDSQKNKPKKSKKAQKPVLTRTPIEQTISHSAPKPKQMTEKEKNLNAVNARIYEAAKQAVEAQREKERQEVLAEAAQAVNQAEQAPSLSATPATETPVSASSTTEAPTTVSAETEAPQDPLAVLPVLPWEHVPSLSISVPADEAGLTAMSLLDNNEEQDADLLNNQSSNASASLTGFSHGRVHPKRRGKRKNKNAVQPKLSESMPPVDQQSRLETPVDNQVVQDTLELSNSIPTDMVYLDHRPQMPSAMSSYSMPSIPSVVSVNSPGYPGYQRASAAPYSGPTYLTHNNNAQQQMRVQLTAMQMLQGGLNNLAGNNSKLSPSQSDHPTFSPLVLPQPRLSTGVSLVEEQDTFAQQNKLDNAFAKSSFIEELITDIIGR